MTITAMGHRRGDALSVAALAGALAIGGVARAQQPRPAPGAAEPALGEAKAAQPEATAIAKDLELKFKEDWKLAGNEIDVKVDPQGSVTLSGRVPSELARSRAVEITHQAKGVTEVKDHMLTRLARPAP